MEGARWDLLRLPPYLVMVVMVVVAGRPRAARQATVESLRLGQRPSAERGRSGGNGEVDKGAMVGGGDERE